LLEISIKRVDRSPFEEQLNNWKSIQTKSLNSTLTYPGQHSGALQLRALHCSEYPVFANLFSLSFTKGNSLSFASSYLGIANTIF